MSNGRVVTAYLLFTVVTAAVLWLIFNHWIAAAIGAGFAVLWWIIASIFGDAILLRTLRASELNVSMYPEVGKLATTSLRIGPRIGPPKLMYIATHSPMLMSIGLSRRSACLVFTKGFFDYLEDKPQIGLMKREVESIRSGATAANTGLATLLWIILAPGRIATVATGKPPGEPNTLSLILNIVPAFFLASIIGLIGFDRTAVHRVDAATLSKLENPDYLPYALMKLQEALLAAPFDVDLALGPCCVVSPNNRDTLQNLFKLHPTTPKRIDRLRIRAKAARRILNK